MADEVRRPATLRELLLRHERVVIVETLRRNGGSCSRAAEILGLSPSTLWRKMRSHGVRVGEVGAAGSLNNFSVDFRSRKK